MKPDILDDYSSQEEQGSLTVKASNHPSGEQLMGYDLMDELTHDDLNQNSLDKVINQPDDDMQEQISSNEVILVLSCAFQKLDDNDEERIKEYFDYIRSNIRCYDSTRKPICTIDEGHLTIGFSKEQLDPIIPSKSFYRFLCSICNCIKTDTFCLATKNQDRYKHKVFKIEYFPEKKSSEAEFIGDSFKNLIESANININIDNNSKERKLFVFKSIHHHGGLVIRNIDCDVELQNEVIQYANAITEKLIIKLGVHLLVESGTLYQMALGPDCNPQIPILMKKDMPGYESDTRWEGVDREYRPIDKMLGYYTRNDEDFCKGPHIVLGAHEIARSAKDPLSFKVLFSKVLVHELAHAIMDIYLDKQDEKTKNAYWPNSKETLAMEESLANMITIECFKEFAPEDVPYVVNYIDNRQPAFYKFGIWQDFIRADWSKWRCCSKRSTTEVKEWFSKCFVDGYIRIPKEHYTKEIYNKVFG